jgi:hypothetical protein
MILRLKLLKRYETEEGFASNYFVEIPTKHSAQALTIFITLTFPIPVVLSLGTAHKPHLSRYPPKDRVDIH